MLTTCTTITKIALLMKIHRVAIHTFPPWMRSCEYETDEAVSGGQILSSKYLDLSTTSFVPITKKLSCCKSLTVRQEYLPKNIGGLDLKV